MSALASRKGMALGVCVTNSQRPQLSESLIIFLQVEPGSLQAPSQPETAVTVRFFSESSELGRGVTPGHVAP